jgi:NAD(P)-dependent dehydrogenase (short-subunit alcohol dehydrogenase family)
MSRVAVVTGSASGIGKATAQLLMSRGQKVIGVDLADADVTVDLSTVEGPTEMAAQVEIISGGHLDAIFAIAGSARATAKAVALNYFGARATLDALRPLLYESASPRAVVVTSFASIHPGDDALLKALHDDDESASFRRATELAQDDALKMMIYPSAKKALSQWVRRQAPTAAWAGAGIPLNAVAPGTTLTPMTAPFLATERGRAALMEITPMPLNGVASPEVVAKMLAWLGGEENTHLCGQIIFVDGGSDALLRGDQAW